MTEADRVQLIQSAAKGDAEALGRILLEYHEPLLRRIGAALFSAPSPLIEPEDILQETYVSAFRALGDPQKAPHFAGPAAFYAWLVQIALNTLRSALRSANAQKRGGVKPAPAGEGGAGGRGRTGRPIGSAGRSGGRARAVRSMNKRQSDQEAEERMIRLHPPAGSGPAAFSAPAGRGAAAP